MLEDVKLSLRLNHHCKWALVLASALEVQTNAPVLRRVITAPPATFHALLLALSEAYEGRRFVSTIPPAAFAQTLVEASAKDLIKAVKGEVPDGLLGLFARLGDSALGRDLYPALWRIFADDDQQARVLSQVSGPIREPMIEAVLRLDPIALHPMTLRLCADANDADQINAVIRVVLSTCSGATPDAVRSSLAATDDIGRWFTGWLQRRLDTLPLGAPFEEDPEFQVLGTAEALRETAIAFKNCLADKNTIALMAAGRATYARGRHLDVIVEFRRLDRGWIAYGVHGPKNLSPGPEARAAVQRLLDRHHIPRFAPPSDDARHVQRLLRVFDLFDEMRGGGFEMDLLEEGVPI